MIGAEKVLALLLTALAGFGAGAAVGFKFHAGLVAERDLAASKIEKKNEDVQRTRGDKAAASHESFKTKAAVRDRIVQVEVDRVVEKPVYLNQCVDDDGLRILAADIDARAVAGVPARAVSSPAQADAERRPRDVPVEP